MECYDSNKFGKTKKLTYKSVLTHMRNFLEKNPSETVIVGTYLGRGNINEWIKRIYEIYDKLVGDITVCFNSDLILGDVRGKIINISILEEEIDKKIQI